LVFADGELKSKSSREGAPKPGFRMST
jgi:hypothetical protein